MYCCIWQAPTTCGDGWSFERTIIRFDLAMINNKDGRETYQFFNIISKLPCHSPIAFTNATRYLIMRLGRHGGTKLSVPVSKNVLQIKYPPGRRTCADKAVCRLARTGWLLHG